MIIFLKFQYEKAAPRKRRQYSSVKTSNLAKITKTTIFLPLLLLRWPYSPMRTFASLMDFSQSALLFDLPVQIVILHLSIYVCTQCHHLFLVVLLVDFPEQYFNYCTYFPFTIHANNITSPTQPTYSAK
jgi:hypothetical protein